MQIWSFFVMFSPAPEVVSKWQIPASSLQLFLLLPLALGREIAPLALTHHRLLPPEGQAPFQLFFTTALQHLSLLLMAFPLEPHPSACPSSLPAHPMPLHDLSSQTRWSFRGWIPPTLHCKHVNTDSSLDCAQLALAKGLLSI